MMEINILEITSSNFILKVAIALTIFSLGLILGKILGKTAQRFIKDSGIEDSIKSTTKIKINFSTFIGAIISYVIIFFSLVWALDILDIASTILNIFSGAILVLFLIVIFLGFKDFIPNATAGFFIHSKGTIQKGDKIRHQNIEGIIESTGIIETVIKTKEGDTIFIPNTRLTQYELIKKNKKSK